MRNPEPTQIGLSEKSHATLKRLKEDGHFSEMVDAYRFGIAFGLSQGVVPDEVPSPRTTVFGVTTVDPEGLISTAISTLSDDKMTPIYKLAERYAEWGVSKLGEHSLNGSIDIPAIINSVTISTDNS